MAYNEDTLDDDLCKSKPQFDKTIKKHVSAWIKFYEHQKDFALTSVVVLVFRACKCPYKVSRAIPDDFSWEYYLKDVENSLEASDTGAVPTVNVKDDKGYTYGKNLSDFISHIMLESQHDILLDDFFSPNLLELLKVLSKSQYRSFRHGATLIALKMITTLSNMMRKLVNQLSASSRQLSVERSKSLGQRSSERVENLETVFSITDMESSRIEEILIALDREVIYPRFRDVCSDICLMCLNELKVWLNEHRKFYLKPKYLEHLRQFLCDSKVVILTNTLKVVRSIYSNCNFPEMDSFTNAIQGNILSLSINDCEAVACLAIQVASAMKDRNPEYIKEDQEEFLKHNVFSPALQASCEAATFFHKMIMNNLKDHIGKNPNFATLYLMELKDFIIKTNGSGKIDLLVESMLSITDSYLLHWKSYVALLLMDEFKAEAQYVLKGLPDDLISSFNAEDEKIIISLMLNTLKQVCTQESPRREKKTKHRQISEAVEQRREESIKSAENLLAFIPRIMKKFMPEIPKTIDLLSMCSIVDFSGYTGSEDIRLFGDAFQKLMKMHVDQQVHIKGAKVLAHLCEGNNMFELFVLKPFLNHIASKWRKSLIAHYKIWQKKLQSPSSHSGEEEEDEENVMFALNKYCSILWSVSCHFSLDEYVDHDELFAISQGVLKENYPVPDQVMKYSYKTLHAIILREAKEKQNNELFKALVEEFCNVGGRILLGDYKCSTKYSVYMCIAEHTCMLRSMMANSPSWLNKCWQGVSIKIIKYFSNLVCKKDEFENMSRKEEEESILTFLMLIKKRVLPQEAEVYALIYQNKEPMKRLSGLVKDTMLTVQSWGMEGFAVALHKALSFGFQDLLFCDEASEARKNELFIEVQELANLFRREYGPSLAKNRMAALKFHICGIDLATSMRNDFEDPAFAAPFIIILSEFHSILHPSDKRSVADHMVQRVKLIEEAKALNLSNMEYFNKYMQQISPQLSLLKKQKKSSHLRTRRNLLEEMDEEGSI